MYSKYGYPPCAEFEIGEEVWCWSIPGDTPIMQGLNLCRIHKRIVSDIRINLVDDGDKPRWLLTYGLLGEGRAAEGELARTWLDAKVDAGNAYRKAARRIAMVIERQEATFIGDSEPVVDVDPPEEIGQDGQAAVETTPTEGAP